MKAILLRDAAAMSQRCSRCGTRNQPAAKYCGRCGALLPAEIQDASPMATATGSGSVCHPDPLAPPDGFRPVQGAPDVFYRWQAAWGGAMLLGTETIAVVLFNGGYPVENVTVRIRGLDQSGREACSVEKEVGALLRGRAVTIEVPSWELSRPASDLDVMLLSGRYVSFS